MSFTKTFPVDTGTFVIVDYENIDLTNPKELLGKVGTIAAYQCVTKKENIYLVMVSGYKDSWCGEYLLDKCLVASDEQVKLYEKEMGI